MLPSPPHLLVSLLAFFSRFFLHFSFFRSSWFFRTVFICVLFYGFFLLFSVEFTFGHSLDRLARIIRAIESPLSVLAEPLTLSNDRVTQDDRCSLGLSYPRPALSAKREREKEREKVGVSFRKTESESETERERERPRGYLRTRGYKVAIFKDPTCTRLLLTFSTV